MEKETIITVLADYVLVKQTMTSKSKRLILDNARNAEDKFDYTFEIVQHRLT